MRRRAFSITTLLFLLVPQLGCATREHPSKGHVMVAAAVSLRNVMPKLVDAYSAEHPGIKIAATYGASGDLRQQVEGGAPIDAVIFASAKPVDDLAAKDRLAPGTRRLIATNRLVLIGPKGGPKLTFATLDQLSKDDKLAIGDPGAVPAGQYARDALKKLGKWEALEGRLVYGGDVGAVLSYVRRGEVPAAIVYWTETIGVTDIVVLDEAKGEWAPRPEIVAAVIRGSAAGTEAQAFLEFVASPKGQRILAEQGFGPPG